MTARIAPLARPGFLARIAHWLSLRRFGRHVAPLDAYAHSPALLAGIASFELMSERTPLDPVLRGLVDLKVASLVGCPFCLDIGSALGRAHGVTERQVRELREHRQSDAFTEVQKLALDFATVMTRAPVDVPDALFDALKAHLGERGMVDLAAAIAWENFRARINHALGMESQGFSEGAFCALPAGPLALPDV